MFRIFFFLSVFVVVSYGQVVLHKVDSLLQSDGLFPGHTLSHVKGHAKQTVNQFSTKIENPQVINAAYNKYKGNFQKQTPPSEDNARMEEFKKSVKRVLEHNLHVADGTETYGKAINKFSDMNFQEFVNKFTGVRYPGRNSTRRPSVSTGSHKKLQFGFASFDWRNQNMITPVKCQESCGCSVVFATTSLVESVYAINNAGQFVSLSEQQLLDCPPNAGGCNGTTYKDILPYVQQASLAAEAEYPFQSKSSGSCQQFTEVASIQGNFKIASGADSIAQTIASTSPVAVDFRVNQDFKDYDGKSIFNSQDPNCDSATDGHAVIAVGYGTDPNSNTSYWIMKNSWGTDWGEEGFFKFARGSNICQIENDPWIATGVGPSTPAPGGNATTPIPVSSTKPPSPVTSTTSAIPVTSTTTSVPATSTNPPSPVTSTTSPVPTTTANPSSPATSTTSPITVTTTPFDSPTTTSSD